MRILLLPMFHIQIILWVNNLKITWKVRLNKLDKNLKPWRRKSCHPAPLILHSFGHPFYVLQNQQRICNDPVLPWMDVIQSWSGWYSPLQKYLKARTILQACLHIRKKLQKSCHCRSLENLHYPKQWILFDCWISLECFCLWPWGHKARLCGLCIKALRGRDPPADRSQTYLKRRWSAPLR